MAERSSSIGVFDSGIGGLTVLSEIRNTLPQYDYIYLGDNARTPYGGRSFEVVYEFTLQAVEKLLDMGCEMVILACNTASSKALRSIQQNVLPRIGSEKRVLGVLRPTTEIIGNYTQTNQVGVLGTTGTVRSQSYVIEIEKFFPDVKVEQEPCPIWVPLIENNLHNSEPGKALIKSHVDALMERAPQTDVLMLACTHYPLVKDIVQSMVPENVKVLSQGSIVAQSLQDYLSRHPEMEEKLTQDGTVRYFTTESPENFTEKAKVFLDDSLDCEHIQLT